MRVHQVLSGAGPVDAVTTQALAMRALFDRWGWGGRDVAAAIDPRVGDAVRPLRALHDGLRADDVLLVHYSAYAPKLRGVLDLPNPKLVLSHNITPARWFWDHDPQIAVQCALGRKQLPEFVAAADEAAGVSLYNARELGSETVIPILFDPAGFGAPGPARRDGPPVILFVGRLAPHKRQDELMRAFTLYRRRHAPDARLVLVGSPLNPPYLAALRALADELAPGAIDIESGLSRAELADRYRAAHAFVCLSEHEGFCIPLLESFHFGVPVIARPVGGIPEVAGDAALLLRGHDLEGEDDGESVVAELMHLAVGDAELRATLRERGAARVAAYAPAPTAEKLRAALTGLSRRSAPSPASSGPRPGGPA
jgi:glycosyltransferase involved in cell wall biosynthesis